MTRRGYPERNPFPYQATVVLEGKQIEPDDSGATRPTLLLGQVRRTHDLVSRYLRQYPMGEGQIVALRGPHGSGKSHAVGYARVRAAASSTVEAAVAPISIYARVDGADFPRLYRDLIKRLSKGVMQDLGWRYLGTFVQDQLGKEAFVSTNDAPVAPSSMMATASPPLDRAKISRAFDEYAVEEGAVHDRENRDLQRISGAGRDFQNALSYLRGAELADEAYDWLLGNPLTEETKRKLGVSRLIDTADYCVTILQLLLALSIRAGRPFLCYIDQYEKLLPVDDPGTTAANIEALRKLAEGAVREGAFLLLAGTDDAWRALPEDLRQRFGNSVIEFPVLSLTEAEQIVQVYLSATPGGVPPVQEIEATVSESDLFPFTKEAIREIVRATSGNLRRILQACNAVFDAGLEEGRRMIDAQQVTRVLKTLDRDVPDEEVVTVEIERLLRLKGLSFQRDYRQSDTERVDYAVVDADGGLRLLIIVTQALFHTDEARTALNTLKLVQEVRRFEVSPPIVLVTLGYASPPVLEKLRRSAAVYQIIVYNRETFAGRFAALLDHLPTVAAPSPAAPAQILAPGPAGPQGPAGPPGRGAEDLERQMAEVKKALEQIAATRATEARTLEERLTQLLTRQATERTASRRDEARIAWAEELRALEQRVREVRAERRAKELEEIQRLQQGYVEWVNTRLDLGSGIVLLALAGFVVYQLATAWAVALDIVAARPDLMDTPSVWTYFFPVFLSRGFLSILFAAVALWLVLRLTKRFSSRIFPLAATIASVDDATRVARNYGSHRRPWFRLPPRLTSRNPQMRLAAVLGAGPDYTTAGNPPDEVAETLSAAMLAEPSGVVRRELAKKFGELDVVHPQSFVQLSRSAPESCYAVEAGIQSGRLWTGPGNQALWSNLPGSYRTLAGLYGLRLKVDPWQGSGLAAQVVQVFVPEGPIQPAPLPQMLAAAFEQGLERVLGADALTELSERQLRDAVRELSPFEEGGLGTFDYLDVIDKVDHYYFFFRQLLSYKERGALEPRGGAADAPL